METKIMSNLLQKVIELPEIVSQQLRSRKSKQVIISLFKEGRITDAEFEDMLNGFEKPVVNVQSLTIDNSIHIDGEVCQSTIGAAAIDYERRSSKEFWERVRK
jgi:hypothetical protein